MNTGPTVVRFPKGDVGPGIEAVRRTPGGMDILVDPADGSRAGAAGGDAPVDVLLVAIGEFAGRAVEVAESLNADGDNITVVDPRWIIPVNPELVGMAAEADLVVVYEDGVIRGGVGSALNEVLSTAEVDTPLRHLAFPDIFPGHATREELLEDVGLDAVSARESIRGWIEGLADRD